MPAPSQRQSVHSAPGGGHLLSLCCLLCCLLRYPFRSRHSPIAY
jgi:hypothetical protein